MHGAVKDGHPAWPLRVAAFALIAAAAMALAMHFDRPVFAHVANRQGVESWVYLASRQVGEFTTWLVVAPLVMISHWWWTSRRSWLFSFERGLIIIWAPMLAGLAGTLIKLAVRRERPDENAGAYVYRAWEEGAWDTSGLGLPSGHAAVAFGGAWMLAMMYPRLAPLWFWAAMFCALSRLMTQAHFLSDVTAGALLGFACAWLVWKSYQRWFAPREPVLLRAWRWMQGTPALRARSIPTSATSPSDGGIRPGSESRGTAA